MTSGHFKNRTPQMHFQRSFKEKLLTDGVKKFHTPTNLFQNISYRNKIMQIIFIPQHYPPPPLPRPNSHFLYDCSHEVILDVNKFCLQIANRFTTLEKHLYVHCLNKRRSTHSSATKPR